jgi:L-amino acid N-acyltransferase YncA
MRGKGFAKKCLFESISFLRKRKTALKHHYAEVKPENVASFKIFKSLGFKPFSSSADMITLIEVYAELIFIEINEDNSDVLFELLKQ